MSRYKYAKKSMRCARLWTALLLSLSPFAFLYCGGRVKSSAPPAVDPVPVPAGWLSGFELIGLSGNVRVYQGYATDGGAHYFFDTKALHKSRSYSTLDPVISNTNVLVDGTNHMGDGDYFDGRLYGVIENFESCSAPPSKVVIRVFDAVSLNSVQIADITADHHEASGIAIIPETREAVINSFCDKNRLFVYSIDTWQLTRTIPLSTPVGQIQGIAYKQGFLYLADTNGGLYGLQLSDGSMRKLMQASMKGEYEGIDLYSGELRWLLNTPDYGHILYRYAPLQTAGQSEATQESDQQATR